MDIKRILRGPVFWVTLAVIGILFGLSFFTGLPGYKEVSVKHGLELLKDGKVETAKIIDGDQRVDLTLTKADGDEGKLVQFYYVAPRGEEIVNAVTAADPKEFTDEVPQPNAFLSFLGLLLPFVIIGLIFWFLVSRMQGGGSRVMQFGKIGRAHV